MWIAPIDKPEKIIELKVFRFDPSKDNKPKYKEYKIPWVRTMTVIEALETLWNTGIYVAFRSNCREFTCGSCAMLINGKPKLACKTLVEDGMVLEPLSKFPVVKDLIVDTSKIAKRFNALKLYPQRYLPTPEKIKVSKNIQKDYTDIYTRCIECYTCLEVCPVLKQSWDDYAGPMFMLQLARLHKHPYDQTDRIKDALTSGLFNCTTCHTCTENCPIELDIPNGVIAKLRRQVYKRKFKPLPGHEYFYNLICETGRSVKHSSTPLLKILDELIEPEKKKTQRKKGE